MAPGGTAETKAATPADDEGVAVAEEEEAAAGNETIAVLLCSAEVG